MYVQIMDGVKQCVISRKWLAGHPLPSIREMAVALKVSVITVKRAYQELESQGVISTRQGMGSFIAEQTLVASEQKEVELTEHLQWAIKIAELLQVRPAELKKRLAKLLEQHHR